MTDRKIKLKSFNISKPWTSNEYKATIAFESVYGEQILNLTAEQTARVLDAALEAIADAARHQADLIRQSVTAELETMIAKERAKALAAPEMTDAEIVK